MKLTKRTPEQTTDALEEAFDLLHEITNYFEGVRNGPFFHKLEKERGFTNRANELMESELDRD